MRVKPIFGGIPGIRRYPQYPPDRPAWTPLPASTGLAGAAGAAAGSRGLRPGRLDHGVPQLRSQRPGETDHHAPPPSCGPGLRRDCPAAARGDAQRRFRPRSHLKDCRSAWGGSTGLL